MVYGVSWTAAERTALPGSEERFLPLLIGGLAQLPTPVVLVLDDLQDITDATLLEGLEFLVRALKRSRR